jgi:glutaminyl-tRNA synthetase
MNQFAATGLDPGAVNADELAKLIEARDRIPRQAFTDALAASADPGFSAESYLGDGQITEAGDLEPLVDRILAANPDHVESYRSGKQGLLGFFVGQVMKETEGRANPKVVNELLREKLDA